MNLRLIFSLCVHVQLIPEFHAFLLLSSTRTQRAPSQHASLFNDSNEGSNNNNNYDEEESLWLESISRRQLISQEKEITTTKNEDNMDLFGNSQRRFRLGYDVALTSYMGSLGVDEMTDWEYYEISDDENDDDDDDGSTTRTKNPRKKVIPFMDPNSPRRTRLRRGDAVRIFRGEFIGVLGQRLRSLGMETRILIKEFNLDESMINMANKDQVGAYQMKDLVLNEIQSITSLQTKLLLMSSYWKEDEREAIKNRQWMKTASQRYTMGKTKNGSTSDDDSNLMRFLEVLAVLEGQSGNRGFPFTMSKSSQQSSFNRPLPMVGLFGQLDLQDFFLDDSIDARQSWNEMFGGKLEPPKVKQSVWIVYEYPGYSSLEIYAQPALLRWVNIPIQKGFWGNPIPPSPLPSWNDRANFVVQGILKGSLEALATIHENGLAHRSIGKQSILLSTIGSDKLEASSPLNTKIDKLKVQFVDFGFSGLIQDTKDKSLKNRARAFNIYTDEGDELSPIDAINFSMAEDLHALGFVFIAILLTSLADIPAANYRLPPTDEDSLQRQLSDIFGKNMDEFREYYDAEEVWNKVVALLDENNKAGWELLKAMCFARERVADGKFTGQVTTARGLLSSPLFR